MFLCRGPLAAFVKTCRFLDFYVRGEEASVLDSERQYHGGKSGGRFNRWWCHTFGDAGDHMNTSTDFLHDLSLLGIPLRLLILPLSVLQQCSTGLGVTYGDILFLGRDFGKDFFSMWNDTAITK